MLGNHRLQVGPGSAHRARGSGRCMVVESLGESRLFETMTVSSGFGPSARPSTGSVLVRGAIQPKSFRLEK